MRRKYSYLLLLPLLILLVAGCPYISDVPLSGPVYSIDGRLIGKWSSCSSNGSCKYLQVFKKSNTEYYFTYKWFDTDKSIWETTTKIAHLTRIAGHLFVNARYKDTYGIYKVVCKDRVMYLYPLSFFEFQTTDNQTIKFTNSRDFRNFIEFHINNDELLLSPERYRRGD